eukprot:m51a1_g11955 hypothetical protein (1004) ;mRNA; f:778401-782851
MIPLRSAWDVRESVVARIGDQGDLLALALSCPAALGQPCMRRLGSLCLRRDPLLPLAATLDRPAPACPPHPRDDAAALAASVFPVGAQSPAFSAFGPAECARAALLFCCAHADAGLRALGLFRAPAGGLEGAAPHLAALALCCACAAGRADVVARLARPPFSLGAASARLGSCRALRLACWSGCAAAVSALASEPYLLAADDAEAAGAARAACQGASVAVLDTLAAPPFCDGSAAAARRSLGSVGALFPDLRSDAHAAVIRRLVAEPFGVDPAAFESADLLAAACAGGAVDLAALLLSFTRADNRKLWRADCYQKAFASGSPQLLDLLDREIGASHDVDRPRIAVAACSSGNADILRRACQPPFSVRAEDVRAHRCKAVVAACRCKDASVLRALSEAPLFIGAEDVRADDCQCLRAACLAGASEVVEALSQPPFCLGCADARAARALTAACIAGKPRVIELLGRPPYWQSSSEPVQNGCALLHAMLSGSPESVEAITGPPYNARDAVYRPGQEERTALYDSLRLLGSTFAIADHSLFATGLSKLLAGNLHDEDMCDRALGMLCENVDRLLPEQVRAVCQAGLMAAINRAVQLHPGNESLAESACYVLVFLANSEWCCAVYAGEWFCMFARLARTYRSVPSILCNMCRALQNIHWDSAPGSHEALVRSGCIAALSSAVDRECTDDVAADVVGLLDCLLSLRQDMAGAYVAEGALQCVARVLEKSRTSAPLLESAGDFLCSLSCCDGFEGAVYDSGVASSLAMHLKEHCDMEYFVSRCCLALSNICVHDPTREKFARSFDVGLVVKAMRCHPHSAEVQRTCSLVLSNLCERPGTHGSVAECGGLEAVVEAIRNFRKTDENGDEEDEEALQDSLYALCLISSEYSESDSILDTLALPPYYVTGTEVRGYGQYAQFYFRQLLEAVCKAGQVAVVRRLLEAPYFIEPAEFTASVTPLENAFAGGSVEMVELLLSFPGATKHTISFGVAANRKTGSVELLNLMAREMTP